MHERTATEANMIPLKMAKREAIEFTDFIHYNSAYRESENLDFQLKSDRKVP